MSTSIPMPQKPHITPNDLRVLWASMQAMVNDIHAPQDTLTEKQWVRAERLMRELDDYVNALDERRKKKAKT